MLVLLQSCKDAFPDSPPEIGGTIFARIHSQHLHFVTLHLCFDFFETTIYFFKPNYVLSQETILTFLSVALAPE
jgi:hypothetical protein